MIPRRQFPWRHLFLTAALTACALALFVAGAILISVSFTPVPDISSFAARQVDQSTKIYDRTGQVLLYDYNRDAKRSVVPIADISPNSINATIATEDSSFYEHGGIRITSIIRSLIVDALGGSLSQGGSTITQQVVKNELLTSRKSISRKINEFVLAIKLEQAYSKDQILETYLNNIPYGGVLYGVEAAAESYFGIPAKDLSITQSAYLAAMIQRPSYYSPYGPHRTELDARKEYVLGRMYTLGFIDAAAYALAKAEEVSFAPTGQNAIVAPHFVIKQGYAVLFQNISGFFKNFSGGGVFFSFVAVNASAGHSPALRFERAVRQILRRVFHQQDFCRVSFLSHQRHKNALTCFLFLFFVHFLPPLFSVFKVFGLDCKNPI